MDRYKKRIIIFLIILILGYVFVSITIGPPTGKFVLVESTMSIVNSMVPTLIQNIPLQIWDEDTNLTLNLTYYFNDTNDINFTATSVQNITIQINNDTNVTIFIPDANFYGSRTVTFTATDGYENTDSNQVTLTVNQIPDVTQTNFPVGTTNTTDFSAYNKTELQNLSNVTIDKPSYGKIEFIENLNISSDINLDINVIISSNSIFINSTAIPSFNKSANLTLYGLTYTNPKILRDGSDCSAAICQKINYSVGILKFNVTQFSTYSAAETSTPSGPSGGGGGGGVSRVIEKKEILSIDKDKLKVKISQGETKKEQLVIKNSGTNTIKIMLQGQKIEDFIRISDSTFDLGPGISKIIDLDFIAREDAIPDIYLGKIIAVSGNIIKETLIAVEILSKFSLFDVKVEIPKEYMEINPGSNLLAQITLYNLGKARQADAKVEFIIKNSDDEVVVITEETVAVETRASLVKTIMIPENIKEGTHLLYVKTTYDGKVSSGSAWFMIIKKPFFERGYTILIVYLTSIILIVAIIAIIGYYYYKRMERELEKYHKRISSMDLYNKKLIRGGGHRFI